MDYIKGEVPEQFAPNQLTVTVSIPKVEPLCCNLSISNEDGLNLDRMITPIIPSTKGYKLKDPIVLLERCDKIWETLKVIKDVQRSKTFTTSNIVSSNTTIQMPQYVEYKPVLNNDNDVLPNLKLFVMATKKLFNCLVCGKEFDCNQTLKRHSQREHLNYVSRKQKVTLYETNMVIHEQKESNMSKKDKIEEYLNGIHSNDHGNELDADFSSQSAPSPVSNIDPNIQLQQKKKDALTYNRDNVNSIESVQKDWQKRLLEGKLTYNEVSALQSNPTSLICVLCKAIVNDMRQHLIDYHKIESPDFMLKNLSYPSSLPNSKELEVNRAAIENLKKIESAQKESTLNFNARKKQQLNDLNTGSRKRRRMISDENELWLEKSYDNNTRKCDICLGIYKASSFYKHLRRHRKRGETKENVHLSNCRYRKSPLYLKNIKLNLANVNARNRSNVKRSKEEKKCLLETEFTEECSMLNNDAQKIVQTEHIEKCNNICSCGKVFHQLHMLAAHKKNCFMSKKAISRTTESSDTNSNQCAKPNSPDRDSGIGINITIKKRDNSYEIIEKDQEKENVNHPKEADAVSDTSQNVKKTQIRHEAQDNLETSQYSERHSVLKIQSVDMDADIDIETDSQTTCNNNITSTGNEVLDTICKVEMSPEIQIKDDSESYNKNPNFALAQKKLLSKINTYKKYNICICGRKFYTRKALQVHMSKHSNSKLMCGYCNVSFSNVTTWNKHQCSIHEGKKFHQIPNEVLCQHCGTIFNTYYKFDEHVRKKHSDPLLQYLCYYCPRRFPTRTTRKQHIDQEHKRNTCFICNNEYQEHLMSRHKAYHYGLGYPCHSCKKAYSNKNNILVHIKNVHHGAKYDYYKSSPTNSMEDDIYEVDNISRKLVLRNKSIEVES